MTKDEIINLAIDAGIDEWWDSGSDWRKTFDDVIERFAYLVAKHTQEQCAKKCEKIAIKHWQEEGTYAAGKKAGAFECAEYLKSMTV